MVQFGFCTARSEPQKADSMIRVPADGGQLPANPANVDPKRSKESGLSQEALARHGGMAPTVGKARPATTDFSRMPARQARNPQARPRSLSARLRPAVPEGAGKAGATLDVAHASLDQAKAAWLEAAKSLSVNKGVLQPQTAQGNLHAGTDNLIRGNLRLISLPEAGEKWLVTDLDPRTESQSKTRRWAISDHGTFACCLEFLPFHERGLNQDALAAERSRRLRPREAAQRAQELSEHEAEVMQEVQTAALLNRDLEVHAFFRTPDNRLVAIMTDFPEEVSYLSTKLDDAQRQAMSYRLFSEVALRLHQDLHRKGLVHGDIKPANIMMTSAGSYTLIDFEHTRPVGSDGLIGRDDCLQATFAPPEYHRSGQMGKAGDMWALGVSLAHMMFWAKAQNHMNQLADNPREQQRLGSLYGRQWGQLDAALQEGQLESVRAALSEATAPAEALRGMLPRAPFLAALQPFAEATPDLFQFAARSLLAFDPALRPDAREARTLGSQLVERHRVSVERNRAAEQEVLRTSASMEMVAPVLREIAKEEFAPQA